MPQALVINNNVNSIINLTKLRFDLMKQMHGRTFCQLCEGKVIENVKLK